MGAFVSPNKQVIVCSAAIVLVGRPPWPSSIRARGAGLRLGGDDGQRASSGCSQSLSARNTNQARSAGLKVGDNQVQSAKPRPRAGPKGEGGAGEGSWHKARSQTRRARGLHRGRWGEPSRERVRRHAGRGTAGPPPIRKYSSPDRDENEGAGLPRRMIAIRSSGRLAVSNQREGRFDHYRGR